MATKPGNTNNRQPTPTTESYNDRPQRNDRIHGGYVGDKAPSINPVQTPRSAMPPPPPKRGGK